MTHEFATSNLSKIKPKLRTSGSISQPRRKAGSTLKDLGNTTKDVVKCVTQDDYLNRMCVAFHNTTDQKLKKFIFEEIRKIKIQRNEW